MMPHLLVGKAAELVADELVLAGLIERLGDSGDLAGNHHGVDRSVVDEETVDHVGIPGPSISFRFGDVLGRGGAIGARDATMPGPVTKDR